MRCPGSHGLISSKIIAFLSLLVIHLFPTKISQIWLIQGTASQSELASINLPGHRIRPWEKINRFKVQAVSLHSLISHKMIYFLFLAALRLSSA